MVEDLVSALCPVKRSPRERVAQPGCNGARSVAVGRGWSLAPGRDTPSSHGSMAPSWGPLCVLSEIAVLREHLLNPELSTPSSEQEITKLCKNGFGFYLLGAHGDQLYVHYLLTPFSFHALGSWESLLSF